MDTSEGEKLVYTIISDYGSTEDAVRHVRRDLMMALEGIDVADSLLGNPGATKEGVLEAANIFQRLADQLQLTIFAKTKSELESEQALMSATKDIAALARKYLAQGHNPTIGMGNARACATYGAAASREKRRELLVECAAWTLMALVRSERT